MSLALASGWLSGAADRLGRAAASAKDLGFVQVHASRPPRDPAAAKEALETRGLTLSAIQADRIEGDLGIGAALTRAAEAAATLRRPQIVLDLGEIVSDVGAESSKGVEKLSRALFAALSGWPGLSVALRVAVRAGGLLDFQATEWLLDDLAGKPIGLWFDPPRAAHLEREGKGPPVLRWADRFGSRIQGVAVHGRGAGEGHAHPEEPGLDWGSLGDLVPSKAWRVLDVGPNVSAEEVRDVRRRFEEVLSW